MCPKITASFRQLEMQSVSFSAPEIALPFSVHRDQKHEGSGMPESELAATNMVFPDHPSWKDLGRLVGPEAAPPQALWKVGTSEIDGFCVPSFTPGSRGGVKRTPPP